MRAHTGRSEQAQTTRERAHRRNHQHSTTIFFHCVCSAQETGKISLEDVMEYMQDKDEDIWDIFGRSMLKDFSSKRGD